MKHWQYGGKLQHGIALVTSMVFLLALTLIGISAMQNTTLQERMAGNVVQAQQRFEAAEATLREIEAMAQIATEKGTTGGLVPLLWSDLVADPSLNLRPADCSGSAIFKAARNGNYTINWQTAPVTGGEYMIIDMGNGFNCVATQEDCPGDPRRYLIVARSVGPSGLEAIHESIFFIPKPRNCP